MKIEVFLLEWKPKGDKLVPKDNHLFKIASEFAKAELAKEINFQDYKSVWIACEVDAERKPVRGLGIAALVFKPDLPVLRFIDQVAVVKLVDRVRGTLQDGYGLRGMECFLHMPSGQGPEQMCPDYEKWMEIFKAKPSDRMAVTI